MASYFHGAHDMHISKLTINAPTHIHSGRTGVSDDPLDYKLDLYSKTAHDAQFDSMARFDAPKCHPETRRAVQEQIFGWIEDGDPSGVLPQKTLMWLSGPAGAGKTAIAGTIAEICEERELLAASFFFSSFSSSEDVRSKRCLVATIAYQLSQLDGFEEYGEYLFSAIRKDPGIFHKHLKAQFTTLVLKPLHSLARGDGGFPTLTQRVIIIDGLDEVEAEGTRDIPPHQARQRNGADQIEILSVLLQGARDPYFPFRIFISSRPERAIRDFFESHASENLVELFLDDKYDPEADIYLFLEAKFAEIRRKYRLPHSWPMALDIDILVQRSSGQFIYPATVVRFLQSGKGPVHALLGSVLKLRGDGVGASTDLGFSIHAHPHDQSRSNLLRSVMEGFPGEAEHLLGNLASLIHVPSPEEQQAPYRLYHKSLIDFLRDMRRCGEELNQVFSTSSDHFGRRYVEILKNKSPAIPLSSLEWKEFGRNFFLGLLQRLSLHRLGQGDKDKESFENDLASCDVLWWIQTVVATCPSTDTPSIISARFDDIHLRCPVWLNFDECNQSCKHWRSGIIRGCKDLGWRVPNAIAYLRDMMSMSPGVNVNGEYAETVEFSRYFKPPADPNSTYTTPDTDYSADIKLAQEMHAHLPSGWESQFGRDVEEHGKTIYNALRPVIRSIRNAMAIEVEDVDVDGA